MSFKPKAIHSFSVSLFMHTLLLIFSPWAKDFSLPSSEEKHQFKIRQVGVANAEREDIIFVPIENRNKQSNTPQMLQFKKIGIPFDVISTKQAAIETKTKRKKIKAIKLNQGDVEKILKSARTSLPSQAQKALDQSDIAIKMEVPKGIPQDELNKYEQVFYSFQKRTVLAYINSFMHELNDFELQNPHLDFPIVQDPEQVAGKITYDHNGDILKIDTLKWSDEKKLQDFFMNVLKNMNSLPNPPKELLNKGTFAINFVLSLNQ
jgi:hypothetical protein